MRALILGLVATLLAACGGADDPKDTTAPAPSTGRLAVEVGGLPTGVAADVWAVGPQGEALRVVASTSLAGLAPGDWQVVAFEVVSQGIGYAPAVAPAVATVVADAEVTATVAYAMPTTGSLRINVSGLPAGVDAALQIVAPSGAPTPVVASTTLTGLTPGPWTGVPSLTTQQEPFADVLFDVKGSTLPVDVFAGELAQANVTWGWRLGTGMLWVPSTFGFDLVGFDNGRLPLTAGGPSFTMGAQAHARSVVVDGAGNLVYTTPTNMVMVVPAAAGGTGGIQALPTFSAPIGGILAGRYGGLWVTLPGTSQLLFFSGASTSLAPSAAAVVGVSGVTQPASIAHCGDSFWVGGTVAGGPIARLAELPTSGSVVRTPIGTVNGGASFPNGVRGLACSPPGSLFATLGTAGKIVRVDFATTGLGSWRELAVGGNPTGVAVDESGNVWFSDPTAGTVSVIDAATATGPSATVAATVMASGLSLDVAQLAFDPPPSGTTLVR